MRIPDDRVSACGSVNEETAQWKCISVTVVKASHSIVAVRASINPFVSMEGSQKARCYLYVLAAGMYTAFLTFRFLSLLLNNNTFSSGLGPLH